MIKNVHFDIDIYSSSGQSSVWRRGIRQDKKSDWNKIMDAFNRAVSRNHLLEKYEKKISALEKKIATLTDQIEKLKQFVASRGLGEVFAEFVKSLAPKSFKQKLEEKKADVAERNQQRRTTQQKMPDKKKKLQQEM